MNWERARKYTVAALILLNIFLFVMNLFNASGKKMTAAQKADITNILRQNGISVGCELPDKRSAESQLTLKRVEFDYLRLQKIFFDSTDSLKRIDATDKVTISNKTQTLTVEGNHIEYTDSSAAVSDKTAAENIAKSMVKNIQTYFGKFYMYSSEENDNAYIFRYTEKAAGLKVYNNIISISLYKDGGLRLGLSYLQTGEHYGDKMNVIPCDEALFAAMPFILEYEGTDKELTVTDVELCYYLQDVPEDEGIAIPCYRIAVNWDRIYYINAYTGVLVN